MNEINNFLVPNDNLPQDCFDQKVIFVSPQVRQLHIATVLS